MLSKSGFDRLLFTLLCCGLFGQCAVVQSIQGPVMRILRKGSCVAIDLPPITLTPARTAAERQLVGEELEIEENGWLIASARSVARLDLEQSATQQQGQNERNIADVERFYQQLGLLDFYEPALHRYRQIGILGESHDGLLKIVPLQLLESRQRRVYQDELRTATEVANQVNQARLWIDQFRKQSELPVDRQEHQMGQAYKSASGGVWVYTPGQQWIKVR